MVVAPMVLTLKHTDELWKRKKYSDCCTQIEITHESAKKKRHKHKCIGVKAQKLRMLKTAVHGRE